MILSCYNFYFFNLHFYFKYFFYVISNKTNEFIYIVVLTLYS